MELMSKNYHFVVLGGLSGILPLPWLAIKYQDH